MVNFDNLTYRIRSLLLGNGVMAKDIIMYDKNGNQTETPQEARVFFISKPNILIMASDGNQFEKLDNPTPNIEFNYYGDDNNEKILAIYKDIKIEANKYLTNSSIKKNIKQILPKDYAHRVKDKEGVFMENNNIKPINHQLKALVLQKVKYFTSKTPVQAYTIADDLGLTLQEIQPILNNLVSDKKIKAERNIKGDVVYSMPVEEALVEGFSRMFGSSKTSKQTFEDVKIIVKHRAPVNEESRGARTRNISSIFIECNGQRVRFKENYLPAARAMARHMAHGGSMDDKVGSYIIENTQNLLKLKSFNKYAVSNNLINEDSSNIIETVSDNIKLIKEELKKLSGVKTYEMVKARIETFEKTKLEEDDTAQLKELFTIKKFDENFNEVLPIIKQMVQEKDNYHRRLEEAASNSIRLKTEYDATPTAFEFISENAKIGHHISELALRIVENEELSKFVGDIGNKISKNKNLNSFEKAIMEKVFENIFIENVNKKLNNQLSESFNLESYFDKFDNTFY